MKILTTRIIVLGCLLSLSACCTVIRTPINLDRSQIIEKLENIEKLKVEYVSKGNLVSKGDYFKISEVDSGDEIKIKRFNSTGQLKEEYVRSERRTVLLSEKEHTALFHQVMKGDEELTLTMVLDDQMNKSDSTHSYFFSIYHDCEEPIDKECKTHIATSGGGRD